MTAASSISDSHSIDDLAALRAIVEGTAHSTGEEFFHTLVRHLAGAMGAQYALLAVFAGETRVRTLAYWQVDRFAQNVEYDLVGTPCYDVVRGNLCHHPSGVSKKFHWTRPSRTWVSKVTWACR